VVCEKFAARGAGGRIFALLLLVLTATTLFQPALRAAEEDVMRATLDNCLHVVIVKKKLSQAVRF